MMAVMTVAIIVITITVAMLVKVAIIIKNTALHPYIANPQGLSHSSTVELLFSCFFPASK